MVGFTFTLKYYFLSQKYFPQDRRDSCRPYLLSLLTHQASYSVLRSTAASLLSPAAAATAGQQPGPSEQLCPRAALDFLSACVHIPRLWQGRDQRPPKHDRPVDVLQLQGEAIVSLVEFVVRSQIWIIFFYIICHRGGTQEFELRSIKFKKNTSDLRSTSWPYFGVKLSCVCLMFADRKK